jgi:CBS domain-containing protein
MTPAPLAISPETAVQEAYRLMQAQDRGHLPVCEDGRLVGLLSERDLRLVLPSPATSLAAHEVHYLLERLTVAEIMTHFPGTIGPDHTVTEAASRMLTHKVHALPVTENRRLVGILTRTHVLYAFLRAQAAQPLAAWDRHVRARAVKKGAIMVDIDLLYCTYRQQELWHEAAAQALAAHVRPARPRWWARVLDTLITLLSGLLGRASRRSHACPVPAVVRVSQPREERTHLW